MYGSDALGGVIHYYTRDPVSTGVEMSSNLQYSTANNGKILHARLNAGNEKIGNIIGFTSSDNRELDGIKFEYDCGLEGIELEYDTELRGSGVQNVFYADPRRRPGKPGGLPGGAIRCPAAAPGVLALAGHQGHQPAVRSRPRAEPGAHTERLVVVAGIARHPRPGSHGQFHGRPAY